MHIVIIIIFFLTSRFCVQKQHPFTYSMIPAIIASVPGVGEDPLVAVPVEPVGLQEAAQLSANSAFLVKSFAKKLQT